MYVLLSLSLIAMVAVLFTNSTSKFPCISVIVKTSVLSMMLSSVMANEMQFVITDEVSSNMPEDAVVSISLPANMRDCILTRNKWRYEKSQI